MTSELRDAALVAHEVCEEMEEYGPTFAERVIEADREAVRAEQAAELANWKALAETLAGALGAIHSEAQRQEGSWLHLKRCIAAQSAEALREYKEARDAS